jgi:hypothetical protein
MMQSRYVGCRVSLDVQHRSLNRGEVGRADVAQRLGRGDPSRLPEHNVPLACGDSTLVRELIG